MLCKFRVHPKVTSQMSESATLNQWFRSRGTSILVCLNKVLDVYVTLKSQLEKPDIFIGENIDTLIGF